MVDRPCAFITSAERDDVQLRWIGKRVFIAEGERVIEAPEPSRESENPDGSKEEFKVNHSYNAQQIEWFKAGGALNIIRASVKA